MAASFRQGGPSPRLRLSPLLPSPYDLRNSDAPSSPSHNANNSLSPFMTPRGLGYTFRTSTPTTAPASPQLLKDGVKAKQRKRPSSLKDETPRRKPQPSPLSVGRLSNGGLLSSPGKGAKHEKTVKSADFLKKQENRSPRMTPSDDHGKRDLSRDSEARDRLRQKFTDALEEDSRAAATAAEVRALVRRHMGLAFENRICPVKERAQELLLESVNSNYGNGTFSESLSSFLASTAVKRHSPEFHFDSVKRLFAEESGTAEKNLNFGTDYPALSSSEDMFPLDNQTLAPPDLIRALSKLSVGRAVLELTGIGRGLAGFPEAAGVVKNWTDRVKKAVRLGFELEGRIFSKHSDKKTGNILCAKDNAVWKYHQDCRSAIGTLRRSFNQSTRQKLLDGSLSSSAFLSALEHDPEAFTNPLSQRQKMHSRARDLESVNDGFEFLDAKMECVRCGQKDKGCHYTPLFYDAWDRSREGTRTVLYKCVTCGAQWRREE